MTKKCRKAFDIGKANRALHPLEPGTYKLLEAYRDWQRLYDTLNMIEDALENRIPIPANYQLGGWTGAEWPVS